MWHRLGRDDFVAAKEATSRDGYPREGEWTVCSDYEIRNRCIWAKHSMSKDDMMREWRGYDPLTDTPDLFLSFARVYERGCSEDLILEWTRKYGVLGSGFNESVGPSETVEGFWEECAWAAGILAMYEAALNKDSKEAERLVSEEFAFLELERMNLERGWYGNSVRKAFGETLAPELLEASRRGLRSLKHFSRKEPEGAALLVDGFVGFLYEGNYLRCALGTAMWRVDSRVKDLCYPVLGYKKDDSWLPSDVRSGLGFRNLLGAMYLQMYWLMTAGGEITRCKYCGRVISLAPPAPDARKTRQDKKYCDDACRQRHHYHTKTKLMRQGESR